MKRLRSRALFKEAQKIIPGGVNSPVRAYGGVGGDPAFLVKGNGSKVSDADGNEYVDLVGSWGPLILGHAHPQVLAAINKAAALGTTFGAPTEAETELASLIRKAMPAVEMVRMVSSGTEAAMSAVRLARAATGRPLILKFDGAYHGHGDAFLVKAGSGVETLGLPDSPGVPHDLAKLTLTVPYNDLAAVTRVFRGKGTQIAAVIVEPVGGNMGVLPPKPGFLEGLAKECKTSGSLLIFDEVITGFRVALGGAQGKFGVKPDLTVLGKIIGGGLPLAAYGGKKELMKMIAPSGPVYQAGTLSGNPLAVAAGLVVLKELAQPGVYDRLEALGARLGQGLLDSAKAAGLPFCVNRVGSMLSPFFGPGPISSAAEARKTDKEKFKKFFWAMQEKGIMLAPSPFEAWFLSLAHSDGDVDLVLGAARDIFKKLGKGG